MHFLSLSLKKRPNNMKKKSTFLPQSLVLEKTKKPKQTKLFVNGDKSVSLFFSFPFLPFLSCFLFLCLSL